MRRPAQYLALLDKLLEDFAPDQLIACNGHPMILEAMARARKRGITTAFAVRGFGYYDDAVLRGRRSRIHVQPVSDRPLPRQSGARQHADRTADRVVVRAGARRSRARS